jgi:2-oxoglutarate ferredoxin oxidoreductase subunit beta
LIKAAMHHRGFAFLNVISPCVTFNNNAGSTKSYDYVREHVEATGTVDFIPLKQEITTEYSEGTDTMVTMHDGSHIKLHKLDQTWDPLNRISAAGALQAARAQGEILTGLLYLNAGYHDLHDTLNTSLKPLNTMTEKELCPGSGALETINADLR